jgi:hypothetical protein
MNEMNEHKKGVKAMKYTAKPRNFVAKNAHIRINVNTNNF